MTATRTPRRAAHDTRPGHWPIPTDTPLDVARTIANALAALVARATSLDELQAQTAASVDQARGFGQTWLGVDLAADGPWLTLAEVARKAGCSEQTVSRWSTNGGPWNGTDQPRMILTRHANGRFLERDVDDFLTARRTYCRL